MRLFMGLSFKKKVGGWMRYRAPTLTSANFKYFFSHKGFQAVKALCKELHKIRRYPYRSSTRCTGYLPTLFARPR